MNKIYVLLSLSLALVVLLTACGGSAAPASYQMTLIDFGFQPNSLTVPAGKSISMTLVNKGSVTHNWTLMSKTVTPPFGPKDQPNVIISKTVDAGKTVTFTFTTPVKPGDYEIICTEPGHLEAGMQATLKVTS